MASLHIGNGSDVQAPVDASRDVIHSDTTNHSVSTPASDTVPLKKVKFGFLLKKMNVTEVPEPQSSRRTAADELADYIATLSVKPSAVAAATLIDPQQFWLQNTIKYQTLGQLSLDVISAPASEAYAERVFSYCGLLTTGRSNRTAQNLNRRAFLHINSTL